MSSNNAMTQPANGGKPTILQYLDKYKDQVAAALPKHMTPDRMVRIVTTSIRKNPALVKCNPQSLFGAIIQASQLGLEVDNALGHAYFVPFKNRRQHTTDVQLIIGYRGFLDLAWRSQKVVGIDAEVVYSDDRFVYSRGLNPTLEHTPHEGPERGERTHAYCIFHLRDGGKVWRVLTRDDVMKAKDFSASAGRSDSPWNTHEDDMWRKTAIRATAKFAPLSIELQQAVGIDEQSEVGKFDTSRVLDGDFMSLPQDDGGQNPGPEPQTKTESVRNKITGGQQAESPEPQESGNGPPSEGSLFAQLDEVINHPTKYSPATINELAALSDAISPARAEEFRDKLGQAYEATKSGGNTKSAPPPQDNGVQGAFFGD